jgi:rare lipoprotein A
MVKRLKQSIVSLNNPIRFWLLMGASLAVLTGAVLICSSHTVLANTLLSQPAASAPSAVQATSATPALNAPQQPAEPETKVGSTKKMLHGVASWYGEAFHGRRTASGEIFNMYAMTACHPTLPFGSVVRVRNLDNNQSVVVRITDRGLLYNGRILDLSMAAAKKLNMLEPGLARVDIKVIKLGPAPTDHP